MIPRGAIALLCLIFSTCLHAAPSLLDIYFEENHAGTFYHLAETISLDEPHRLILIDAHSDASAVTDSDRVRDALRKVATTDDRTKLLASWRKQGVIQCYDWLEPLMPLPFDEVHWIAAPNLSPIDIARQQTLAHESLDGLLEAFPRRAGELGPRYHALDWKRAQPLLHTTSNKPTVVSIDLDYFAATPDADLEKEFRRIFDTILAIPKLHSITFSLSTPWLRDLDQAQRLATLALDATANVANARVHFASQASTGPDRSRRAQEFRKRNQPIPTLTLDRANPELRSLLISRRHRLAPDPALIAHLGPWSRDPFLPHAHVVGEVPDPDGHHRLRADKSATVRLENSTSGKIEWFALVPKHTSVNLTEFNFGFADDAPRQLVYTPQALGNGPEFSTATLRPLLEPMSGTGTIVLYATVKRDGEIWRSNELILAFRTKSGFRAALSEGFARPYAFGCGLLPGGPDTFLATDCANFIISALRRQGWRIPWGDPKQFAEHCTELAQWKHGDDSPAIPENAVESGLFIHFGNHVGAVWEDLPPVGNLDSNDLIAHHLEGLPEIVPLSKLTQKRKAFRILHRTHNPNAIRLVFGGDVMLGRRVAQAIDDGKLPLAPLTNLLTSADWSCINLECVASDQGTPTQKKPSHFRAHPRTPDLLATAGIDAVSLANNHARDFGPLAFNDAITRLNAAGLRTLNGSATPLAFTIRDQPFAAFACEASASDELLQAVTEASKHAAVIVFAHWGTEHQSEPDETQRALADRFIAAGARLIIGCGPHIRQSIEFRRGALIAWSLGNLIFDGPGPDLHWSRGALLEIELCPDERITRAFPHPIRIDNSGTATISE